MRKLSILLAFTLLIPAALAIAADAAPLDTDTRQALLDALDDERRAHATYVAAAERYAGGPFARIAESETFHESHLLSLFAAYGLEAPPDPWAEREIDLPATLAEACAEAVEGERDNAALYDRLLSTVTEADVRAVFTRLAARSTDRHLPAFERCAGDGGAGPGTAARGGGCARGKMGRGDGAGTGRRQMNRGGEGPGMGGGEMGRGACKRAAAGDGAPGGCACRRQPGSAAPGQPANRR